MGNVLVIQGSARDDGGTAHAVRRLETGLGGAHAHTVDLAALDIQPFRYGAAPLDDGFEPTIRRMLEASAVVFATPVYWYAMSGVMKVFFDRLADLTVHPERRPMGRALAGREAWLMALGTDLELPSCVTDPFRLTADYFDWRWREALYVRCVGDEPPAERQMATVEAFGRRIAASITHRDTGKS